MIPLAMPSRLALAYVLARAQDEGSPRPYPVLYGSPDVNAQADRLLALNGEAVVLCCQQRIPFAAVGLMETEAAHLRRAWWVGVLSEARKHAPAVLRFLREQHEDLRREGVRRVEFWTLPGAATVYQRPTERLLEVLGYRLEGSHADVGPDGEAIATWAHRSDRGQPDYAADCKSVYPAPAPPSADVADSKSAAH